MHAASKTKPQSTKKRHTIYFAVALLTGLIMAFRPDYVGNVGFLILGALIAIFSVILVDEYKREAQATDLARALYEELANRVARCCFDFETPWERWVELANCKPNEVNVIRLRGFIPFSPIVYPATASHIALLNDDSQQALITFYATLTAYQQDMTDIADLCQQRDINIPPDLVARVAGRLSRTLPPAYEALKTLGEMVDNPEAIDAAAIRYADTLFDHERSHLQLRKRIEYYLTVYRKRSNTQCWHFCSNCSEWPSDDYQESIDRPAARDLCQECKNKLSKKECTPKKKT